MQDRRSHRSGRQSSAFRRRQGCRRPLGRPRASRTRRRVLPVQGSRPALCHGRMRRTPARGPRLAPSAPALLVKEAFHAQRRFRPARHALPRHRRRRGSPSPITSRRFWRQASAASSPVGSPVRARPSPPREGAPRAHRGRGGRPARAGRRRHRHQFHRRHHRGHPHGTTGRRLGGAGGDALLQQARPGGHVPALRGGGTRGRPALGPPQRAPAHQCDAGARDHRPARAVAQHLRPARRERGLRPPACGGGGLRRPALADRPF